MSEQDVIKKLLETLSGHLKASNEVKCLEQLAIIAEYFDSQHLTSSQLGYAIELLLKFKEMKINLLYFLAKKTKLSDCNRKIFDLIQSLSKHHPTSIAPYSKDIVDICKMYIMWTDCKASEKESAVQTLHDLVMNDALNESVEIEKIIAAVVKVITTNATIRLQQHAFELLGAISKKHPEKFSQETAAEVRNKMLETILSLFKDDRASVSLTLISGAVEGLKRHLENFTPTPEQDPKFSEKLYNCIKQLTDPEKIADSSNRVPFRNMLHMLHRYGGLHEIPGFLFRDCTKHWHKVLIKWISSKSYDDKNAGVHATQTFHQQIASVLEQRKNEEDKRVLLFFMKYFQETLESPESQPHEIRIAIRGFGSMAAACKILLDPKYLSERFDLVMQRTEYSYHTKDHNKRREVLEHLPNYVESLSQIMNQLVEISGIQLQSLESIVVILIKDFHYLSTVHQALVATSLLETFTNFQKLGGKVLDSVLESVIWQGILWTCSHQLVYDMQNLDNVKNWKETITYRRYLPLWMQLLKPLNDKHLKISKIIYDHFIKDLFLIIDKLDLSTQKRKFHDEATGTDQEFFFSDPSLNLVPVRTENFHILYNLVSFYSDVILTQTNEYLRTNFMEWLELWLEKCIQLSFKHPLVSGFLQLVEISLKVIDRLDLASHDDLNDVSEYNGIVRKTIEPIDVYIKSMLLMRCQQTSGELQVASLNLIFQVPTKILKNHVSELSPVFVIGFSIGKSLLPVAHHALTCFEKIIDSLSEDPKTRRQLLEDILPCLETFLSSQDSGGTDVTQLRRNQKKSKFIVQSTETDLMRFKKRILLFLGHFNPDEAQLVLSKFDQKLVRDHVTSNLNVLLHCNEPSIPKIFLDDIINRVCQLAVTSSERATKISACELLHGMVLYIMGKNLETIPMWKELCNNLIVLGADKDETVRHLYEPLLMQIMHYFAQPSKMISPMATSLVQSLMAMICHRNSGIQDLSARLLREYILWLNKADRNLRNAAPVKLVDLFQEMKKMSIETDASRRMGATLAFNNIYRCVREDEVQISVFWLYLLDVFGTNFKSSEDYSIDFENNFTDGRRFEQVSASMDHLTRVFVERDDLFQQSNNDRIIPSGFEGQTLNHVLLWLFQESGQHQYHYRHKTMEMFMKILPQSCTKEDFFKSLSGEEFMEETDMSEEKSLAKILSIGEMKHPDLNHLKDCQEPIFSEIYKWMQTLLTSLDFYFWIFENELMPQHVIPDFLDKSIVLTTLSYFIKNIFKKDMVDLLRSIDEELLDDRSQFSREAKMRDQNVENIATIRLIILVRIIDFLTLLLKSHQIAQFLDDNKPELMKITKMLIFKPQYLYFDYKSKTTSPLRLPKRLTDFVVSIHENAPIEFKEPVMSLLQKKLLKHLNALYVNCEALMNEGTASMLNINKVKGIELVITKMRDILGLDFHGQELLSKTAELLLKKLFDGITETTSEIRRPRRLTPSIKAFATSIMRLCLKIDVFLNKIVVFSFNDEPLRVTDNCIIKHGEHFIQIFKQPIFELFTAMLTQTIQLLVGGMKETSDSNRLRIISLLTELNDFIFYRHKENVKLLNENITAMIAQWPTLIRVTLAMENNLNSIDLALINLIKHMAMTSPIEHKEMGQRLERFQMWLFGLLENKDNSLEIKSKAIFLLPCITDSEDKINEKLMKALDSIQQRHMPLRSHEKPFTEGSLERAGLVALTNSLFEALLRSRSPVIYRFIINATIADEDYILEDELQSVQVNLMKTLSSQEQEVIMNQTFEAFVNGGFSPEIRLNFVSRFLLTIMKKCNVDVMLSFVRHKMNAIWGLTESSLSFDAENAFVNRCGGYMMIEAFVASVPKETVERESFSYAGKVSKGADMIKELIKKTKDVRRDVYVVDDPVRQELFRKFQCYSYRALAATVANLKDPKDSSAAALLNLTLFKEMPSKNEFIWRNLINVKNDNLYADWAQDFEEKPCFKEYIVSVKGELKSNQPENRDRKYIETISIFDRSLSQSLTKTDLSNSVVYSNREALEREQQRRELEHQKTMSVSLDSTPLNDHEVMSVLIGIVNHISNNKISPIDNLEREDAKKYEWVLSIAASMKNPGNHKNERIFLAKLVENCRHVFMHYAKQLIGPVLSVIVDGCLGDKMNFFITDLVTMLLSWSNAKRDEHQKPYKPTDMSEKQDACRLLKFLMENAFHELDEIFKLNLELIKKLVETWSEVLAEKIPNQTLLDLLQKPIVQEVDHKLRCGIQLNAVVLANDLVPWNTSEQRNLFIKAIVGCFSHPKPQVYQAAAQLLGMFLQKIVGSDEPQEGSDIFEIIEQIELKLKTIQKRSIDKKDLNVFLQLLYGIQKGFPRILDSFMTTIQNQISTAIKRIKCIYLEMFLSRLEYFGERVYAEIITIAVFDLMKQNDFQLLALHIINKALGKLSSDQIQRHMDDFNFLVTSQRDDVRRILYEMMIFIVEKFKDDATFDKKKPIRIILKGFTDADQQIQNRVLKFFSEDGGLDTKFAGRFLDLLKNFYDPSLEKEFLHYATQLLLDIPIRNNNSKNPLLNYDSTKSTGFVEYSINTKSSIQRSLPPMFTQSQRRQLIAGDGSMNEELLKASQAGTDHRAFSPTLDPKELSQVTSTFDFKQTQNSLFVNLKPQLLDKRSNPWSQGSLDDVISDVSIARNKENSKFDALDYLRKRVVKNNDQKKSKDFAMRAIEKRDFQEAERQEKVKLVRAGREVVLYRRYRHGDLPDFFFNGLAILMPLQALAKKDGVVARDVFISIFQAILMILEEKQDDSAKDFLKSINASIMSILQQTKNTDTFFLGTIIEMAMKSEKYLEISPDVLANVSSLSNMMVTGALFLESQLIHLLKGIEDREDEEEPNAKRHRISHDETNLRHWLKLIELNYKMGEYEVITGIFTEKINLAPAARNELMQAIDLESGGKFSEASSLYKNLIVQNSARNQSEKEFYYQSYFNCLANLSDWRVVTTQIRSQFNSYNEVWDETVPFYKETLLPHLLKSELRMILIEDVDSEFVNILEGWLKDDNKSCQMWDYHDEIITMLTVVEEEFAVGSVRAENSIRKYCDEWSCLEMLDEKLKCLKKARNMAEITNFLLMMSPQTIDSVKLEKMYQSWKLSHPKASDSLVDWSDLIAYRKQFNSSITADLRGDSASYLLEIKQNLLNVAFAQKNIDSSKFMINDLKDDIKGTSNEEKNLVKNLAIGKYTLMVAEQKITSPDEQIRKLGNGLSKLLENERKKANTKNYPSVMIESYSCASEISWKLWRIFEKCRAGGHVVPQNLENDILQTIGAMEDDNSDITDHLLRYSENAIKDAKKWAQKYVEGSFNPDKEILLADVYLKMGQFYYQVYGSGTLTTKQIQLKIIKSIFAAIAYGNDEAKIYLPQILQLADLKNNELTKEFNEALNLVPVWMFITYISQMLSSFDFENDSYLDGLLMKLAVKYPNALYFPFKLSRGNYKRMSESRMEKAHVLHINDVISNPAMDSFMNALDCLVLPEKLLAVHFQNFEYFIDSAGKTLTNEKFQEQVKKLHYEVFEKNWTLRGSMKRNIQASSAKIKELTTLNWGTQKKEIIGKIARLRDEINKPSRGRLASVDLDKLSKWMFDYKWSGDKDFIEMPGQYNGDVKPFVEQHVKVVRFEQRLKIFSSKQKPVEVKIQGSDGKFYSFIIKYGEDLRQDQRIQHALELMSRQLAMDKNCKQNHLKIQTYQVIPIDPNFGMMSVVENATTITDYLHEAATKNIVNGAVQWPNLLASAKERFRGFLLGNESNSNFAKIYEIGILRHTREQLAEEVAEIEKTIPNLLCKSLMSSALSLETYYILRKNFITSLATMSIAHWLLGIGDRHLSNILIDKETGKLIGIDFGIAFGAAANLAVPEMVPFRLTPIFVNVLQPMGIDGMMKKNMIHVLRCLRDYSRNILICLEMFVNEPTMDWLMRSKMKSVGNVGADASMASSDWNPEARIAIVQRKLEGANPVYITKDELSISQIASNQPLLNRYMDLAEGGDGSLRVMEKGDDLTVEEQVTCLIDMATDKALLASVYLGWEPWI